MMRTSARRGGRFYCKFTKVSVCQNYENIMKFDKVIAKIIMVQFVCLTVLPMSYLTFLRNKHGWMDGLQRRLT